MVAKRLSEEDCNAGAIFDNLECQYWKDQKDAIELICDAMPQQNVEVVLFNFNREQVQDPDMSARSAQTENDGMTEVCTNYRYSKRHDPAHKPKVEEK